MPQKKMSRSEAGKKGAEQAHKKGAGFENMDPEKREAAARKGGQHSHGGGRPSGS